MTPDEEEFAEKIVKEARKIAERMFPGAIQDESIKEFWTTGFVSGYLERTTEELKSKTIKN